MSNPARPGEGQNPACSDAVTVTVTATGTGGASRRTGSTCARVHRVFQAFRHRFVICKVIPVAETDRACRRHVRGTATID